MAGNSPCLELARSKMVSPHTWKMLFPGLHSRLEKQPGWKKTVGNESWLEEDLCECRRSLVMKHQYFRSKREFVEISALSSLEEGKPEVNRKLSRQTKTNSFFFLDIAALVVTTVAVMKICFIPIILETERKEKYASYTAIKKN